MPWKRKGSLPESLTVIAAVFKPGERAITGPTSVRKMSKEVGKIPTSNWDKPIDKLGGRKAD
jgi:hypothetical protein